MNVKDSNGTELNAGDSVTVVKDLKVKGAAMTIKRGTLYKDICLTDNEEEIECGKGRNTIVLKTCFLKESLTSNPELLFLLDDELIIYGGYNLNFANIAFDVLFDFIIFTEPFPNDAL